MKEIPDGIKQAVNALLLPYGVSIDTLQQVNEGYFTPKTASEYCGLSPKTIRDKALQGAFICRKVGTEKQSRLLIPKAEFIKWLEKSSITINARKTCRGGTL